MKIIQYLLLFFVFGVSTANCQISKIDSLLTLLKTAKEDTNKENLLLKLGGEYEDADDYEKELNSSYVALTLAESLTIGKTKGWNKGVANTYTKIASAFFQ
ncbi:MAG: hypothetical protein HYU68_03155 [Bacteroidetes bacterium]|nr:hypothetical protein [Bacteroidota bacterium]